MRLAGSNIRDRGKAGFTLTELLIVLLLIGIFTGVMLAEMRGTFDDALLRSTARDLMSGLSLASSRAVTLNHPHAFTFDRASNEFSVQAKESRPAANDGSSGKPANETRKLDERITIEIRDPDQTTEEDEAEPDVSGARRDEPSQPDVVRFYPDGTADRREITLRDKNNVELVLRINPVTGRVRLEEQE